MLAEISWASRHQALKNAGVWFGAPISRRTAEEASMGCIIGNGDEPSGD